MHELDAGLGRDVGTGIHGAAPGVNGMQKAECGMQDASRCIDVGRTERSEARRELPMGVAGVAPLRPPSRLSSAVS